MIYLLHLPPPLNGSTIVGNTIEKKLNNFPNEQSLFINILLSSDNKQIGYFHFQKILKVLKIFSKLIYSLFKCKSKQIYFAFSISGKAVYKDIFLLAILKLFKFKILFHFHNKLAFSKKSLLVYFLKVLFRNTSAIFLSKSLLQDSKHFGFRQTYICANGIDVNYVIKESYISKLDSHNDKRIIKVLVCSNLFKFKGILDLFEIVGSINNIGKFKYIIKVIGDNGDLSFSDMNLVAHKLNCESHIEFLGPLYQNDKYDIFSDSDIFLHPTYDDCFPLVLIEAFYFGLPVISTNVGSIPEIVENGINGYSVEPGQIRLLVEKLILLFENPLLRINISNSNLVKYKNYTQIKFIQSLKDIINNEIKG